MHALLFTYISKSEDEFLNVKQLIQRSRAFEILTDVVQLPFKDVEIIALPIGELKYLFSPYLGHCSELSNLIIFISISEKNLNLICFYFICVGNSLI